MTASFLVISLVVISAIIGSVGSLFLKIGSEKFDIGVKRGMKRLIVENIKNWKLIIGIALYGFATISFIIALKMAELSVVYPMTSLGYIFVTILSVVFLKEKINKFVLIGIASIIFGVVLVTL